MFSLKILLRNRSLPCSTSLQLKRLTSSVKNDDSSSSDSSDDEGDKYKGTRKNTEALNRLNLLLQSMVKEEKKTSSGLSQKLAKPKVQIKQKKDKDVEETKTKVSVDPLADAAKKVAESFGGDMEQTESELLSKLRSHSMNGEQTAPKSNISLSELIVGMKIDRSPKPSGEPDGGRAQQVRNILSSQQRLRSREQEFDLKPMRGRRPGYQRQEVQLSTVDLFGGEPLKIFQPLDPKTVKDSGIELKTWKRLQQRELKLAVTHPPANIFEEMILWTEQGKLWKFPINNEQGLDEEAKVYFTEHVFLERHLEPWCPRQGPIRHFMELVCVGLSKNPYITVQAKRDHIEWFRKYFENKKEVLEEVGALGSTPSPKKLEA